MLGRLARGYGRSGEAFLRAEPSASPGSFLQKKCLGAGIYALEASAVLNDAYRTLRDPVARALYVLKLEGFDIAEQGTKDVPPELLEEVFELNMALEELRGGDEDVLPQLRAARGRFEGMRDQIDADLRVVFGAWDTTRSRAELDAVRGLLNRRKYVTNLIARTDEAATPHQTQNVSD